MFAAHFCANRVTGDPGFKNQGSPLVANRAEETYEDTYGIPRGDWEWALRGKDPLTWRLLQQDRGHPRARPLFFSLTIYMDKFRRG